MWTEKKKSSKDKVGFMIAFSVTDVISKRNKSTCKAMTKLFFHVLCFLFDLMCLRWTFFSKQSSLGLQKKVEVYSVLDLCVESPSLAETPFLMVQEINQVHVNKTLEKLGMQLGFCVGGGG